MLLPPPPPSVIICANGGIPKGRGFSEVCGGYPPFKTIRSGLTANSMSIDGLPASGG
jgi:hypothetical protein